MSLLKYNDLVTKSEEVISKLYELLSSPLSEDIVELGSQATEVEGYYGMVLYFLPQAELYYRKEEYKILSDLMDKSERKPNEFDKKICVDAKASDYKLMRDTLKNMAEAIKQRISLAQSILRNNTENKSYNG
jgi:RNA binding exosome subunit